MITSWSTGSAEEAMDEAILTDLSRTVHKHPWWIARAKLVRDILQELGVRPPASVLEAGCGWGTNLAVLEKAGYGMTGLDISRASLQVIDRPGRHLIEADLSKPLPDVPTPFDSVLALDVIEHIDDDAGALRRLGQLVKPGGPIIISVPALPELYSEFDEVQGHRRRYTEQTLRNCILESGMVVKRVLWWGQWMVKILRARQSRTKVHSDVTPAAIYKKYLSLPPWPGPLALQLMFGLDKKRTMDGRNSTGTSLIAIAVRSEADHTSHAPQQRHG